jgi:hypothetical protein
MVGMRAERAGPDDVGSVKSAGVSVMVQFELIVPDVLASVARMFG